MKSALDDASYRRFLKRALYNNLRSKCPGALTFENSRQGWENFLAHGSASEGGGAAGANTRHGVLDHISHEFTILGDGGFEDGQGTKVSHTSMHAVSHTVSILGLLVRLSKKLPKDGDLLTQEGVELFLEEVATSQHQRCERVLAAAGYLLTPCSQQAEHQDGTSSQKSKFHSGGIW